VGHQAYAHKILTGRLAQFDTLRQTNGLAGFPTPLESPYDVHPSGHASDSLSVALGLAKARDLRGSDEHVVAVIGDASISGGMAFEALNEIAQEHVRMVIILNDNGMSIAPNVGALARHLDDLRAWNAYRERRRSLETVLAGSGPAAKAALTLLNGTRIAAKNLFLPNKSLMFEQLGITCLSPVNGHDIGALRRVLRRALASNGPTLVHVVTKKGAGYEPAERTPELFHGVGPYDAATGKLAVAPLDRPTFTDAFGYALLREGRADQRIVAITAAMEDGTGLTPFAQRFPKRFTDVGIAEEHALGLAAGLAIGGAKPVVALYSTFLQRAVDQLAIDIALPQLDVVVCIDRAGLVGADGMTHQGAFDISFTRMLPNMRVLAPSNAHEMADALHTALIVGGPFAIRYPKGECADMLPSGSPSVWEAGVSHQLREGSDVAILALGSMVRPALEAARLLAAEGIDARVVDLRWAKPLDREAILAAAETKLIVTVEEGVIAGGVGEGVLDVLAREGVSAPVLTLGLPDTFIPHGTCSELLAECGLDAEGIKRSVMDRL
jgi:1-deoxy-D-xylulose-5-phosphate synthase